ncbi:MAG: isoprenylcysteine carboxyl methyltransferase family protein [Vulcanimicrobiaceae bacterium]
MTWLYGTLLVVAAQRIAELFYARANTRRALAAGGIEIAARQHRWLVALHAAWFVSMLLFIPRESAPNLALLGTYAALQIARVWTIASLGPYWTTRIITFPDRPLVMRGPYRFMRHPNYAIVAFEIAILPLAFGAWQIALTFSALNAIALALRLGAEDPALDARRR